MPADVAIGLVVDGILDLLGRMGAGVADAVSRYRQDERHPSTVHARSEAASEALHGAMASAAV